MKSNQRKASAVAIRRVKVRYFFIALVPISIFWLNTVITDHLMPPDLNVPADLVQEGRHWLEAAGRYRFIAATWFYSAFTVLAVALLVRSLARPTARETRAAVIATMAFILLLVVAPMINQNASPDEPRVYHRLGSAVFEATLAQGTLPGCNEPDDRWLLGRCGEIPILSLLSRVLDIVNVLAALGVGALVIGMILCLATCESEDVEEEAALLAQNLQQMRQQLYLSGLILTFGMFFVTSWMYWPLPLIVDAERSAYGSLILAAALYTGTYFSLLILGFYLPVALILNSRVRKLAEMAERNGKTGEPLDVDEWRASHGLKEGTSDYLRAGLALTAPILAAFAGGITPIAL